MSLACGAAAGSRGWAPPVPTEEAVLISTGKGRLDGLDPQSLQQRWRFPGSWKLPEGAGRLAGIYAAPVVDDEGVVYVGDYNGYVYAFRPDDLTAAPGEERPPAAAFKLSAPVIGGLLLDDERGVLFVTAGERLYALSAADLVARIANPKAAVRLTTLFETGADIWAAPLLYEGTLYLASLDGNLYAIDPSSGSLRWRFSAGSGLVFTPVLAGDVLLVGGFGSRLYAVDRASGRERWSFPAANWVWARPLVDGGRAYFGDFDGNFYAVSVANGSLLWRQRLTGGAVIGAPALAGRQIVVGTRGGWLHAIDAGGSSLAWRKEVPNVSLSADLVLANGDVLIAPTGCSQQEGSAEKVYYARVDAETGELRAAAGVC